MSESSSGSEPAAPSGDPGPEERRKRAEQRLQLATAILSLIYTAYILWIMLVPEHQRRLILMRAASQVRSLSARAAFRTGHQAMGLEISGSGRNYELPYRLSQLRDLSGRIYERLRYTA